MDLDQGGGGGSGCMTALTDHAQTARHCLSPWTTGVEAGRRGRLQSFPAILCHNGVDAAHLGLSGLVSALAEKLGISTQSKVNRL